MSLFAARNTPKPATQNPVSPFWFIIILMNFGYDGLNDELDKLVSFHQ